MSKLFLRNRNSSLTRSLEFFNKNEKRKLQIITIAQILMNFLDLLGIILIGALGALSIQGIESKPAGNKVMLVLKFLGVGHLGFQKQITILGIIGCLVLVAKTIISGIIVRKTFLFLSFKSAKISSELTHKFLNLNLLDVQSKTSQEVLYIMSDGVKNLMLGIVGSSITITTDFAMLLIVFSGLLVIDPILALSTICIFACMAFSLNRVLQIRARKIGTRISELSIAGNEKILEVLGSYRESVVRNRREFYANEISKIKIDFANVAAELNFQPFISKYVIEITAVLASLIVAGYEFMVKDAVHAISTLIIFMAASARIAPGVLRIQQSFLAIKTSSGSALGTFDLFDYLKVRDYKKFQSLDPDFKYEGFVPTVEINNLNFAYQKNGRKKIISNLNLKINAGDSVAIVGPSGAGKTTLVDLILGILEPDSGSVFLSGQPSIEALSKWTGAVSYVPQDIYVSSGSIRENVRLGFNPDLASDKLIWNSLNRAQLSEFVESLPEGLSSEVGERGNKLSGGQRQRLGIARALFTNPKLIILDEATSALDNQTEFAFNKAIESLSNEVTLIIVAHRLSTVRKAKRVMYLENGAIRAIGTFEEVRNQVPNFDKQAELLN